MLCKSTTSNAEFRPRRRRHRRRARAQVVFDDHHGQTLVKAKKTLEGRTVTAAA
jgi:hypothetical protein